MAAGLAALLPAAAIADGISGYIEEGVTTGHTDITDATGETQRLRTTQFVQRYRLALDRAVFPTLRVAAGGLFERTITDRKEQDLDLGSADRSWNAFGNVLYTIPTLTLGAGYNRRETFIAGGLGLIAEEYSVLGTWRPEALPTLTLRLARPSSFDADRSSRDLASYEGLLTASWNPVRGVDLGYSVSYSNPRDRVLGSETVTWLQTGRASYSDVLLGGRSSVAISGSATRRITEIRAAGSGATSATQQAPIGGFSLVETGVATRERDSLTANPALIDGDVTASAGVDLGFSRVLAGDSNYRDLGAQLRDAVTPVNTIYVWVDRDLTPEVAQAFRFEAWISDNNVEWAQVGVVKQLFAQFVSLQDRFEITIADTRSRFVKVVVKPLLPSISTEPRFADIFVTEVQLVLVEPLPASRQTDASNGGILSTSLRTVLFPSINLAHDVSLYLNSQQRPGQNAATVWVLLNGLSASRQITDVFLVSGRFARQDADQLRGHEGTFLYSASVGATPLPTLSHTLVYSGQVQDTADGQATTSSVALFNQATPYAGIGLVAALSYNVTTNVQGQTSRTDSVSLTSTLQPHPKLTLSGSFAHSATISDGGGQPRSSFVTNRLDGTVTFVPVRALYASVTATRIVQEPQPATLASAALSFNPFPGGSLQAGVSYNENLDADQSRTRFLAPFVRWNVRRGTILNVSYTILRTDFHSQGSQRSQNFNANLAVAL